MRGLLPAALAVCIALSVASAQAGEAEPKRVAILPIAVHSSAPDTDYVSDGLSSMLAARLEQIGGIRVIRVPGAADATARVSEAIGAGRKVDAKYVLWGSFTQFGEGASLDVSCAEVGPEGEEQEAPRRVFVQSGTMAEIMPKIDDLAAKVGLYLNEGVPLARDVATVAPEGAAEGASEPGAEDGVLAELRERVEALEKAVYQTNVVEDARAATTEVITEPAPES